MESKRTGARWALREGTAAAHARVDAVFSAFDLTTRDGYARFMAAQAAAHLPVEAALDAAGIAAIVPDWPERRRGAALAGDLAALGAPAPDPLPAPQLSGTAAMLGALYVLEGSRLGGALLRRSVPAGWPAAFLSAGDLPMWQRLLAILDARLDDVEERDGAIAAADLIFAMFETSGRRHLRTVIR